jgi:hypothetical protein
MVVSNDATFVSNVRRCCHLRLERVKKGPQKLMRFHKFRMDTPIVEFIRSGMSTSIQGKDEYNAENERDVFFVAASDAKALKTALEKDGLLDKAYRMTQASQNSPIEHLEKTHIAIPVKKEGFTKLEEGEAEWIGLVVGTGKQEVPLSTSVMARKSQKQPLRGK